MLLAMLSWVYAVRATLPCAKLSGENSRPDPSDYMRGLSPFHITVDTCTPTSKCHVPHTGACSARD